MIFIILRENEIKYTKKMIEEKNKRLSEIEKEMFILTKEKNKLVKDIKILKQQLEDDYRESYRED